ncbi:tRNA-2-methylthio-N(6)-dimethylallyladenosine synthase [Chlamydiales bacterium SCGC AB-751-O23]|jgi:tRNA-2-methylthio-N6-dimethylallyladenosine synthase|nr:tRNA-2-methylthio-N(6)-dimethylallyladenosine synthase [Chlamydiales bacterium SCGC AB-751-O23]
MLKKEVKTFFIKTYGCQMNELDSEIMIGILENRGLSRSEDEMQADILIYNSCSIRDLAERKVMGRIGKLVRGSRKNAIIGVTGCMAMAKKDSLFRKLPHVDFVLGTNNIMDLDKVLDEVLTTGNKVHYTQDQFEENLDYLVAKRDDPVKAYVSIIRGCDKFCTYCVVPYTRGQEVSRDPDSIVRECQQLVDKGYKEVTLLGQNVNSYGKDKKEFNCLFHDLLYRLDNIDGLERIRFMTSHPYDITEELMHAVGTLPSLCKFIHFPIQAGSDRILRKMNRLYTVEDYLKKVRRFREIVPNVALGTDIIVGFPTETDEEFQMTYDVLKEIEYSVAFVFSYSERKGTPAKRWKDDVAEEVKKERLHRLLELQNGICAKQREVFLGKPTKVLVESASMKDKQYLKGRTSCWKNVVFPGDLSQVGTIQTIDIHSFSHQTLLGELALERKVLEVS